MCSVFFWITSNFRPNDFRQWDMESISPSMPMTALKTGPRTGGWKSYCQGRKKRNDQGVTAVKISRNDPNENRESQTGWLTTFNDLVTLMMVFFVLLFTMSTIDTRKIEGFSDALQSALGVLGEGNRVNVRVKPKIRPETDAGEKDAVRQDEKRLKIQEGNKKPGDSKEPVPVDHSLKEPLHPLESIPGLAVAFSKNGAKITLESGFFFQLGRSDLNPKGIRLLNRISAIIAQITNPIRVEGHTDNIPIHTDRFPSNWELSIARAVNVVRHMIEEGKIHPQRLSAVGYGESRNIFPNDTPENRAKNRRVEIIIVKEEMK
jgi:chemotaxis protein MotB